MLRMLVHSSLTIKCSRGFATRPWQVRAPWTRRRPACRPRALSFRRVLCSAPATGGQSLGYDPHSTIASGDCQLHPRAVMPVILRQMLAVSGFGVERPRLLGAARSAGPRLCRWRRAGAQADERKAHPGLRVPWLYRREARRRVVARGRWRRLAGVHKLAGCPMLRSAVRSPRRGGFAVLVHTILHCLVSGGRRLTTDRAGHRRGVPEPQPGDRHMGSGVSLPVPRCPHRSGGARQPQVGSQQRSRAASAKAVTQRLGTFRTFLPRSTAVVLCEISLEIQITATSDRASSGPTVFLLGGGVGKPKPPLHSHSCIPADHPMGSCKII